VLGRADSWFVGLDGRVAPRSGLASKHFIDTGAGVIDADYRGQVKVLLFNHAEVDYRIKEGERVAQLVLERVSLPHRSHAGSFLEGKGRYADCMYNRSIRLRWWRWTVWKRV
jgi:deoxyuridine 5'-triphosphate nucleotidohydrolase